MFLLWVLLCLFAFGLMVQLSLHAAMQEELMLRSEDCNEPTAVVVVAKNEEQTLPGLIEDLSKQQGLNLRFVFIDDHSDDGTADLIKEARATDDRFNLEKLKSTCHGKKSALHQVVPTLDATYIVLTDADCRISDDNYVLSIRNALNQRNADLLVGSGLIGGAKNWLQRIIAQQTIRQHQLFHAAIKWGVPFMAVGRSMAFRKAAFVELNGMQSHLDHASGTDDLLLQDVVSNGKRVLTMPFAVTWTTPPETLKDWVIQRNRHLSVGDRYHPSALFLVWTFELLSIVLPLLAVVSIMIFPLGWMTGIALSVFVLQLLLTDIISLQYLDAARVGSSAPHLRMADVVVSSVNALISTVAAGRKPEKWIKRK